MVWKIHSNYISQLLFLSECRFHRLSFNEIEITRNENSESICHANREYRTFYAMNKVQLMLFSFYRSSLGLVCRITANRKSNNVASVQCSPFTAIRHFTLTLFVRHARKSFCMLLTATRSCGRFGPDTDVTIVLKSNVII